MGVGQDVTETGCIGVAHPIVGCPVEYDLVQIDGADLYSGVGAPTCARSPAAPLAAYPVSR